MAAFPTTVLLAPGKFAGATTARSTPIIHILARCSCGARMWPPLDDLRTAAMLVRLQTCCATAASRSTLPKCDHPPDCLLLLLPCTLVSSASSSLEENGGRSSSADVEEPTIFSLLERVLFSLDITRSQPEDHRCHSVRCSRGRHWRDRAVPTDSPWRRESKREGLRSNRPSGMSRSMTSPKPNVRSLQQTMATPHSSHAQAVVKRMLRCGAAV